MHHGHVFRQHAKGAIYFSSPTNINIAKQCICMLLFFILASAKQHIKWLGKTVRPFIIEVQGLRIIPKTMDALLLY